MTNALTTKFKLDQQLKKGEISFETYHRLMLPLYEKNQ